MRFRMMSTYVAVILIALLLLIIYIMGILSANLYDTEKVKLFAKANIIADAVTDTTNISAETSFNINQVLSGSSMRSIVVDRSYRVCFDTAADSDLLGKIIIRESINKCMTEGEQAFALHTSGETRMMSVAVPMTTGSGVIYLVEAITDIDGVISNIRQKLIFFSILISILVAMLSLGLSLMTTAPIDNFISVSKEISKGNFNIKAKEKGCSELVEMAKALNYMSSELDDFESHRKKFVSDVSHELKTPLATIKLICDSIVTTDNPDPAMIQDFLGDLSDEVDRLTRLVERLLTLTKMDSSSQTSTNMTPVDFVVMINAIVRKLTPNAQAKNMLLYTEDSAERLEPMLLDYDKIWEAVYNIVDNAIKYTPEGGFVRLSLSLENNNVLLKIADNGLGIPEEERERIFDRFYRLDDSRARDTGGTGLGLAIAKEAVVLHGGDISISSSEEGGSIFTIRLPYSSGTVAKEVSL